TSPPTSWPRTETPPPLPRGQGTAGACEIALVTDRIRSKDGLREGLAQCTMGGKPAGVKSSSGARTACCRRRAGTQVSRCLLRNPSNACHPEVILQPERERASIASGAKLTSLSSTLLRR